MCPLGNNDLKCHLGGQSKRSSALFVGEPHKFCFSCWLLKDVKLLSWSQYILSATLGAKLALQVPSWGQKVCYIVFLVTKMSALVLPWCKTSALVPSWELKCVLGVPSWEAKYANVLESQNMRLSEFLGAKMCTEYICLVDNYAKVHSWSKRCAFMHSWEAK